MKKDLIKVILSVAVIAICVTFYNDVNADTNKVVEIANIFNVVI